MEPKKAKGGLTAMDIVAVVFSILGVVFTAVAAVVALNLDAVRANSTGDPTLFPIIFGAIGAPFLILGIAFAAISIKKRATAKRVVEDGYYIMADVADIRPNFSVQVNGQYPYVLECHYPDPATGALHVFRSRNLFFYPKELEGRQVRVFVDKANMKHYYVDVEGLVPSVEIH